MHAGEKSYTLSFPQVRVALGAADCAWQGI